MSNPYTEELLRRIANRYSIDSAEMSMGDWVCQNTSLNGRPFSFDRYPFQKRITDDMHNNMDVMKPSQVGLSEVQIRKSLGFIARNRGTTLIFTMPNEKMYRRMSSTRIKPLLDEERAFNLETRSGEKPSRSLGLYQVGSSFMFVTGATESDATSISADAVMNDEIDLTDQQMLALFNSRLQNSDWKINQRFSTPTFSGFGVDKGFQNSDQHEYLCKCQACNHWQAPLFQPEFIHIPGLPDSIEHLTEIDEQLMDEGELDLVNAYVKCEKCHAPLPLGDTGAREWVPRFASRDHARGYKVSPFSTDRLSIQYIVSQLLRYKSRDNLRGWHNTVLGEAHTAGNARLNDADIDACFTARAGVPLIDASAPTWLGIDVGQTCHLLVGQGNSDEDMHVVRFMEVPVKQLSSTVEELLATYNVIGGAVDRFPYTPDADELWRISQGRILPVEYRGQKEINLVRDQVTEDVIYAQMNRTRFLDIVAARVRSKKVHFSGYEDKKHVIREHLKDLVRDESPEKEATWIKLSGQDHYFHGLGFLLAAPKLKETQNYLFTDRRSTVSLGGVSVALPQAQAVGGLSKFKPKSGLL